MEYGLIAQEVQEIFPTLVSTVDEEKNLMGLSYIQLVPILVKGIQEQQTQIQNLQEENKKLLEKLNFYQGMDDKVNLLLDELNTIKSKLADENN